MAATVFPNTLLDQPEAFADLFGNFWPHVFGGHEQFLALMAALCEVYQQVGQAADEAFNCVDRNTIPVYARVRRMPLRLLESQRQNFPLVYDAGYSYDATGLSYDGDATVGSRFPLAGLEFALAVYDDPVAPQQIWSSGVDFWLADRQEIRFVDNPFDNPSLTPVTVFTNGEPTDRSLLLWLVDVQIDRRYLETHLGYVLGWRGASTTAAHGFLNGLMDCIVGGTSTTSLLRALMAAAGARLAEVTGEVVEVVTESSQDLIVVTDQTSYLMPPGAVAIVAVGDVLKRGQALCNAVAIHELNRGTLPPLGGIALSRSACLVGDIIAINDQVALTVDDSGATTLVSFDLVGSEPAVTGFWEHVRAREIALDTTVAKGLDVRPTPDDHPTPQSLPATVNPMEFFCTNLLRNGAFIVELDVGAMRTYEIFDLLPYLRRVVPPGRLMLLSVVVTFDDDSIRMGVDDEELTITSVAEPFEDESVGPFVSVRLLPIRNVGN